MNAGDFRIESLQVQLDACRVKNVELQTKLQESDDSNKILQDRLRLFEQKRIDEAFADNEVPRSRNTATNNIIDYLSWN